MSDSQPSQTQVQQKGNVFDVDQLQQLVELMEAHDLSEVNLREGGRKIRLRRGGIVATPATAAPVVAPAAAAPAPAAAAPAAAPAESDNITTITSPMVGTFYSRPNPDTSAFVKVGDSVEPETTVCIIEAMKVFNEIPAEIRGKIVAILVKDEESLEFGKPIFKVDTSTG